MPHGGASGRGPFLKASSSNRPTWPERHSNHSTATAELLTQESVQRILDERIFPRERTLEEVACIRRLSIIFGT